MENQLWKFINRNGDFEFHHPDKISRLYFPLANESEFMASITPCLKGDIKTSHNHFLMPPVSSETLYDTKSCRNFWIYINPDKIMSISKKAKSS